MPSKNLARALCALAILLGVLVHTPSLGWGYLADDHGAQLVIEGRLESPTWKPWSLYDFGSMDLAPKHALERGAFPWWTDTDWRVRFLRPLTSLSLWLDHALFGRQAVAGHAVNLALFAALLGCALRLYQTLGLSRRAALLAILVLAFDNGSLMPVGWLANRNSLLEGLFTLLALLAGQAAIARASAWRGAAALLFAGMALASKESGLCAFAALALLYWPTPSRAPGARVRLAMLCACGLLAGAYLVGYASLGYGSNVLFYPTPWAEPLVFTGRALALLCCAPIAAVSPFPVDALMVEPAAYGPVLALALLLGLPLLLLFARRLRGLPNAGFFVLWGLFALLPQAGAPPSDRLLFTPMIAWAPLVAMFLESTLADAATRARAPAGVRRTAWVLACSALLLSPLTLLGLGTAMQGGARRLRTLIAGADVGPASLGVRHAFVLQASPSALLTLGPLSTWLFEGGSEDVRWHPLQSGRRALTWTRLGESSFALETSDEPFLSLPMEGVFLTGAPVAAGLREWRAADFVVRGTPNAQGELRRLEFELALPLDDPRNRFLLFDGRRLVHTPPPPMGASQSLPRGAKDPILP